MIDCLNSLRPLVNISSIFVLIPNFERFFTGLMYRDYKDRGHGIRTASEGLLDSYCKGVNILLETGTCNILNHQTEVANVIFLNEIREKLY